MKEQFIIFDWKGVMAHFRQFDANSSSLSYSFPPPTVIMGMTAGLLGMQRDQYYDILGPENLKIGVQILRPPRKIMQTMNYIFAKSPNDLNMSGDNLHTQIPVELVVSESFPNDWLHYRIFLQVHDETLGEFISTAITDRKFKYPPFFGSAPFTSWIEPVGTPEQVEVVEADSVTVDSVVDLNAVELPSLSLEPIDDKPPAFFKEHMRRAFLPGREPGVLVDVIWERNRGKIRAAFSKPVYKFMLSGQTVNISFF